MKDNLNKYAKDDFRLIYNNNMWKIHKFLKKQGVGIEKLRIIIFRSLLSNAL